MIHGMFIGVLISFEILMYFYSAVVQDLIDEYIACEKPDYVTKVSIHTVMNQWMINQYIYDRVNDLFI
jgi:hypothetical protein